MADAAPAAPAASGRGRAIAARTLTVLALVVALVGGIAFYLERTILNDDGIETIATELIQSDEIRQQVAATAVEQLYANVDVEAAIAERLPEAQKALAPVLAGIARQGAEEAANRLLERPRLQAAWVSVATATQRQLVELLDDEGEFVSTTGGEVTLDLRPIIIDLGNETAIIGRVAEQLPESAGRIAIVDSDQLETAQTLARILRALSNWLWLLALVLAALAVWLARGRRRIELRALAVGLIVVGVLTLLARRLAGAYLVDELTTDATEPAGADAWSIVTQGLADRAWVAIVLGALVLAGVWLVGPTGIAARARRLVAPVAERPLWTYGAVAALVILLASLVPLFARGLSSFVVFVVLLVVGVEVLRRIVLAERGTA
jgi:hypothetical protein